MEKYIVRIVQSSDFNSKILVFGLGHYISYKDGKDDFSKKIYNFHMKGWYPMIKDEVLTLFNQRLKDYFDLIVVIPSSEKGSVNKNLVKLAEFISKSENLPYKQILHRNKTVEKMHELDTIKERINNIKKSIEVKEKVSGKKIL